VIVQRAEPDWSGETIPRLTLLTDLHAAREKLADAQSLPRTWSTTSPIVLERAGLLASLEAYAAALTAHHLPVPPRIRDDLRLHRNLAALKPRDRDGAGSVYLWPPA
jgi:hypothetical protein